MQTSSEFQISSKYLFHFLNADLASGSLSRIPLIGKIIIFTATLHLTHTNLNYLPIFFFWKLNMESRRINKCILLLLLCLIIKKWSCKSNSARISLLAHLSPTGHCYVWAESVGVLQSYCSGSEITILCLNRPIFD